MQKREYQKVLRNRLINYIIFQDKNLELSFFRISQHYVY